MVALVCPSADQPVDATGAGVQDLWSSRVRMPDHVVWRDFGAESVALNVHTGQYHGLNASAAQMLHCLLESDCAGDALGALAVRWEVSRATLERDVSQLCRQLVEHGIVEIQAPTAP